MLRKLTFAVIAVSFCFPAVSMAQGPETEETLKVKVAQAVRMLAVEGIVNYSGHVSARVPGTNRIVINSRDASREIVQAANIVTVDLDGNKVAGKEGEPDETWMHLSIYRARPDVNAICRTHGKFANVMSVLRRTLRPVHELAVPVGPEVPLFDTPELISSLEVGRRMVAALGQARALLLRGNGQLTVGTGIEEAVVNAIHLETSAEIQWRALAVGEPAWIAGDEYTGEFAKLAKREYEAILRPWEYYLSQSRAC